MESKYEASCNRPQSKKRWEVVMTGKLIDAELAEALLMTNSEAGDRRRSNLLGI